MKIITQQKDLLATLSQCCSVADHRGTMPILASALLTPQDGRLSVQTTDLYQSVNGWLSAAAEPGESIAINARDLLERVKALTGEITITTDATAVTLKSGSRRFRLSYVAGSEFPSLQSPEGARSLFSICGDNLSAFLDSVTFSVSTDETRLHLNSLLLESQGDLLRAVSTDGHRLTVVERKQPTANQFKILLPLKGVMLLKRLADQAGDEAVTVEASDRDLFVTSGRFVSSARLATDVTYPPYESVIPSSTTSVCVVDRERLRETIKAIAIAAPERTESVRLTFEPGKLTVSTESIDSGDGFDCIDAEYGGAKLEVGFAARYLVEALGGIASERVTVGVSGDLDPIKITPTDGDRYTAVCMPLRI